MIRLIKNENIPCWYELSWEKKPPAIVFRIHKDFIKNSNLSSENLDKFWLVKDLMDKFKFAEFSGDFNKDIGFNRVFKRRGEKDNFIEFLIKIPRVKKKTNETCPNCGGSGKSQYISLDRKCDFCGGTGKKYDWDALSSYAISASFTVFTSLLKYCEKDTSAAYPQLITVDTITHYDSHGGSLGGEISIPLKQYLMSLGGKYEELSEITQAMKIAYKRMLGFHRYNDADFKVSLRENGRFTADCPGNACGIYPDWYDREDQGYKFNCHNVDNPEQQITLLVGLAALHDMARKGIK